MCSPVPVNRFPAHLAYVRCATAFGNEKETLDALLAGKSALALTPVLGADGGECVPMALREPMSITAPPRWWPDLLDFLLPLANKGWGGPRRPVFVSSSNYGIDGLYGLAGTRDEAHAKWASAHDCVNRLAEALAWGANRILVSHACVSAQVALHLAAQWMQEDMADKALVVSFDFVGPFVAAGFHSLKILNARMPTPYQVSGIGSIGLGDGMACAVLERTGDGPVIAAQALFNEMHHFTANKGDGSGFRTTISALSTGLRKEECWIKGHGTGTLEAGRLEAEAVQALLPGCPLVSWKGALGHTLGSCALVELAIAVAALRAGRIPGTVGTNSPCFTAEVQTKPFAAAPFNNALLLSNAFGGAHAAMLLTYA